MNVLIWLKTHFFNTVPTLLMQICHASLVFEFPEKKNLLTDPAGTFNLFAHTEDLHTQCFLEGPKYMIITYGMRMGEYASWNADTLFVKLLHVLCEIVCYAVTTYQNWPNSNVLTKMQDSCGFSSKSQYAILLIVIPLGM